MIFCVAKIKVQNLLLSDEVNRKEHFTDWLGAIIGTYSEKRN